MDLLSVLMQYFLLIAGYTMNADLGAFILIILMAKRKYYVSYRSLFVSSKIITRLFSDIQGLQPLSFLKVGYCKHGNFLEPIV